MLAACALALPCPHPPDDVLLQLAAIIATLFGGAEPLTGTLRFDLFGPDNTICSGSPVFTSTKTVSGNGDYVADAFMTTSPGTYRFKVTYSGDANNAPVSSSCTDPAETVVVTKRNPVITGQASPRITLGGTISDTVTLSGAIAPTGIIIFTVFGPDDGTCSRPAAFTSTVPVVGNGSYSSAILTPTIPGTYRFVATYGGDANNSAAGPTACDDSAQAVVVSTTLPPTTTTIAGQPPPEQNQSPPPDQQQPIVLDIPFDFAAPVPWLLIVLGVAVVGGLLALPEVVRRWRRRRRGPITDPTQALLDLWDRAMRALSALGFRGDPAQTPIEVSDRATAAFPVVARPLHDLAVAATAASFAPHGEVADIAGTNRNGPHDWCTTIEDTVEDSLGLRSRVRRYFTVWQ